MFERLSLAKNQELMIIAINSWKPVMCYLPAVYSVEFKHSFILTDITAAKLFLLPVDKL